QRCRGFAPFALMRDGGAVEMNGEQRVQGVQDGEQDDRHRQDVECKRLPAWRGIIAPILQGVFPTAATSARSPKFSGARRKGAEAFEIRGNFMRAALSTR